jgi:hypothetical protein
LLIGFCSLSVWAVVAAHFGGVTALFVENCLRAD